MKVMKQMKDVRAMKRDLKTASSASDHVNVMAKMGLLDKSEAAQMGFAATIADKGYLAQGDFDQAAATGVLGETARLGKRLQDEASGDVEASLWAEVLSTLRAAVHPQKMHDAASLLDAVAGRARKEAAHSARTDEAICEVLALMRRAIASDAMYVAQSVVSQGFGYLNVVSEAAPERLIARLEELVEVVESLSKQPTVLGMQFHSLGLFCNLAGSDPAAVSPVAARLATAVESVETDPMMQRGVMQNWVVRLCGVLSCHLPAADAQPHMKRMVQLAVQSVDLAPAASCPGASSAVNMVFPAFIQEMRVLHVKNPAVIDEAALECVREYAKSSDPSTRDCSEEFLRQYKGITLTKVAQSVERHEVELSALNARLTSTCRTVQDLRVYMDQNISDLKGFLAQVTRKLPVPCAFDVQRKFLIRKAIRMHFACGRALEDCTYPGGKTSGDTFTIESSDWVRWLKIAMSAVKVGKAVMNVDWDKVQEAVGGVDPEKAKEAAGQLAEGNVVKSMEAIYAAYKDTDDKLFLAFATQPFLTSSEQDFLVNQLRERCFFNDFSYSPDEALWCCKACGPELAPIQIDEESMTGTCGCSKQCRVQ